MNTLDTFPNKIFVYTGEEKFGGWESWEILDAEDVDVQNDVSNNPEHYIEYVKVKTSEDL